MISFITLDVYPYARFQHKKVRKYLAFYAILSFLHLR